MRTWVLCSLLALRGCAKGTDTGGDGDADADADTDADSDSDSDADGYDKTGDPTRDPDETFEGDLATGHTIDLGWADSSAADYCWPGNENSNFTGNHVFFEIDKKGNDNVAFSVDPDSGVDVSLYFLEFSSADAIEYPPDVTDVSRCEASYDYQSDGNPGEKELWLMQGPGTGDRALLMGVAGANGQTSGKFTVRVWYGDTDGYDGPR